MDFFELSESEKKFVKVLNRYGLIIVVLGVAIYALSDWDRFYFRYLAKEEEKEQGYYYSTQKDYCWEKVYLVESKKQIDYLYHSEGSLIFKVDEDSFRNTYLMLDASRLFFIEHKGRSNNGIEYSYGYQYINDSSHRTRYGMVPDYFQNKEPIEQDLEPCR